MRYLLPFTLIVVKFLFDTGINDSGFITFTQITSNRSYEEILYPPGTAAGI